jgi:hypothetical protein
MRGSGVRAVDGALLLHDARPTLEALLDARMQRALRKPAVRTALPGGEAGAQLDPSSTVPALQTWKRPACTASTTCLDSIRCRTFASGMITP